MESHKYKEKIQTISIIFILSALVLSHKIVEIFGVRFSVSSFIFPNTLLITNIAAIVYGHEQSSKIMWETLKAQIPFTVICSIAIYLPSPEHHIGDSAYKYVFNDLWQISLASLIGTYIGLRANIYALSKCNLLIKYRGFWLRTLFACGVGEIVFTLIAVPLMFFNKVNLSSLSSIVLTSIVVKLLYSSLLSYISELIAKRLMKVENIIQTEIDFTYNPFVLDKKKVNS